MLLFKSYHYRLTKEDSAGKLFARVSQALGKIGFRGYRLLFYLGDGPYNKISACARAVKRFPQLRAFLFERTETIGGKNLPFSVLTNLDERWDISNPAVPHDEVPETILAEIADGVPKAFPFHYANFVFDNVPWVENSRPDPYRPPRKFSSELMAGCLSPCARIGSHWWTTRRMNELVATLQLPLPPADSPTLLPLPVRTQEVLDQLGRVGWEEPRVVPVGDEMHLFNEAQAEAKSIAEKWKRTLREAIKSLPLPHQLPDDKLVRFPEIIPDGISYKSELLTLYKPRGYRYRSDLSGHRTYYLTKQTARNNQVAIMFDVGGMMSRSLAGFISVRGPAGHVAVDLLFTSAPKSQYSVADSQAWQQMAANSAVVVDYLEQTFVPEADAAYGSTPEWFSF